MLVAKPREPESRLTPPARLVPRRPQRILRHSSVMEDNNVHVTVPSEREDLKHEDTVLGGSATDGGDAAGYEQSINPVGEVPPTADGGRIAAEDEPIASQVDRDPSNLGDDIPNEGDLVHPAPMNAPVGKMPGM